MIDEKNKNYEAFQVAPRCSKCKALLNLSYLQCVENCVETNKELTFWRKIFYEWKSMWLK